MQYAFIIKNFIPFCQKIQMLHAQFGKIVCHYSVASQAHHCGIGSFVLCDVVKIGSKYRLESIEHVLTTTSQDMQQLQFIHEIMSICMHALPNAVAVDDIFEFLKQVYINISLLSPAGRSIVILRLLYLCELLPEDVAAYRLAMLDPYTISHDVPKQKIEECLKFGWQKVLQAQQQSKSLHIL